MNRGERGICILAGVCFALGAGLFFAPGVRFSAYFCLGAGCLCLFWLALCRLSKKHPFWNWCKRVFLVGISALLLVLACFEAAIISRGNRDWTALPADAVIVLGAGVNGETPSLTLRTRINAAADYLEDHPDIPVVLSGGQGSGENISEAEAMRRELEGLSGRLLLEDQSTSTAENFAFSKKLLKEYGVDTETATIAVVTNDFHILRAQLIAQREGMHTFGIPAELPWWWLSANYYLREPFALVKTLLFD